MLIKGFKSEWFQDYKKPSMLIAFPSCTFKCEQDCGQRVCQNGALVQSPCFYVPNTELYDKYLSNPITQSIVCGGLEPMDSFDELIPFIKVLREKYECEDDVVIYTGYTESECQEVLTLLKPIKNIVIKFGRFIPDKKKKYDSVLGVTLASDNQYGKRIS